MLLRRRFRRLRLLLLWRRLRWLRLLARRRRWRAGLMLLRGRLRRLRLLLLWRRLRRLYLMLLQRRWLPRPPRWLLLLLTFALWRLRDQEPGLGRRRLDRFNDHS
jgi:hypothetical protein